MPRDRKPGVKQAGLAALPASYPTFLHDLKGRIRTARIKASLAVNRELIALYWHIGCSIAQRQYNKGWGSNIIDRLAGDIQKAFPGIEGFSPSNISRMRAFFLAWTGAPSISAQAVPKSTAAKSARLVPKSDVDGPPPPVAAIPWGHNVVLLFKARTPAERLWYAQQTVVQGWSRAMLTHWIESGLYARRGKAITNFKRTLPTPQSDLAVEIVRDPYHFDFLTLRADAAERELEQGLLAHVRKFLLELGAGFAFVGQQVHLEVDGEDFYLDLLFYHLKLRCYVIVDLKTRPFKPEYAGKMNFYLSAVDDRLRHPDDKPSIGLILCKTRSKVVAEYALRDLAKPIGVAHYLTKLMETLPARLKGQLPAIADLERELGSTSNG
ncbi:MAG: PDDEXK nuclease domain-containing protein [Fibrobacterota bacterium]